MYMKEIQLRGENILYIFHMFFLESLIWRNLTLNMKFSISLYIKWRQLCSHDFNSVDRDTALYMYESKFEHQTSHLFILRVEFLATKLFDKRKNSANYIYWSWQNGLPRP
jgi:hypothetical protein